MDFQAELQPELKTRSPLELLGESPVAFRGVDPPGAALLREAFGVSTVRELAEHTLLMWLARTARACREGALEVLPAEAADHLDAAWVGRPCAEWSEAPLTALPGLLPALAERLREAFGWRLLGELADAPLLAAAEAVRLAATEQATVQAKERVAAPAAAAARSAPRAAPVGNPFGAVLARRRAEVSAESGAPAAVAPAGAPELRVPPGSDIQPGAIQASRPKPLKRSKEDYTPDGIYLPRMGGKRGWFENSGVPLSERPNNYRFDQAVDAETFRATILQNVHPVDLRDAPRIAVQYRVRYTTEGGEPPQTGFCMDLSLSGAKLRLREDLAPETALALEMFATRDESEGQSPLVTLNGTVTWRDVAVRSKTSPRYYTGIRFADLGLPQKEGLAHLLAAAKSAAF